MDPRNSFGPQLEILTGAQKALWPRLSDVPGLGFVLYGGTAIALRLGHRQSVDSDFFTVGTGCLLEPEWTRDGTMLVAPMTDLLAHKLKVVLQRLEAKDYVDIHAMVAHGLHLEEGLAGARALFGRTFQPAEALKALTWFQGGDLQALPARVRKDLVAAVARVQDLPAIPEVRKGLGGGLA